MLYDPPCKIKVCQLGIRWLCHCNAHICSNSLCRNILLLNEDSSVHAYVLIVSAFFLAHVNLEETEILLRTENLESFRSE